LEPDCERARVIVLNPYSDDKGSSFIDCRVLKEKVYPIDRAIEKMPIPNKEYTFKSEGFSHSFCRCIYSSVS